MYLKSKILFIIITGGNICERDIKIKNWCVNCHLSLQLLAYVVSKVSIFVYRLHRDWCDILSRSTINVILS